MNIDRIDYGVPVWVRFGQGRKAIKEKGLILDFADSAEGNYYWTKVELIKENPLSPGQILRQVHPQPIQSYRLSLRTPDEGERAPTPVKRQRTNRTEEKARLMADLKSLV